MADQYLQYTHNVISEDTVYKFLNRSVPIVDKMSVYDFLMFGEDGGKNIDRIFANYDAELYSRWEETYKTILNSDKEKFMGLRYNDGHTTSEALDQLPLLLNTELKVPLGTYKEEFIINKNRNLFLEQKEVVGYWAQNLVTLLKDPMYIKSENIGFEDKGFDVTLINQNVQVWVWCRALDKIINISPFIQNCQIQKQEQGNFSLSLAPLNNISDYYNLGNQNVLSYFSLREPDGTIQMDFFNNFFQQNDVVFIRFEKLQIEADNGNKEYDFEISRSELPGKVWDMIGLIDNVGMSVDYSSSNHDVSISGRDFTKLLIEDGSYFLKLGYILTEDGRSTFVDVYNKEDKWYKRNFDGRFDNGPYFFISTQKSIPEVVGFIVNQLSNLGVLNGSDLFSQYKTRRTEKYKISNDKIGSQTIDGVWQIIKFFVDSQLDKRTIVDASLAYVDGTLLEQFQKLCQQPFVEFYGDTYGDEFNFIIRQPPFNKEAYMDFLEGSFRAVSSSLVPASEGNSMDVARAKSKALIDVKKQQGYRDKVISSPVITVYEGDVSSLSLNWDETYYSWFQVNPCNDIFGENQQMVIGSLIPIVYFTEIAECFGNHRKIVQDIYIDINGISANDENGINFYRKSLFNDLKYLIDTNVYLPFTRKGTITLAKGDRRIKRGTFIRLQQTGEIFYVDAVSNSINITGNGFDRNTVLTVSRGMFEVNIDGEFSYFKIVVTETKETQNEGNPKVEEPKGKNITDKYSVKIPKYASLSSGTTGRSSIAYRHNNPGNLKYVGQPTATKGDVAKDGGFWAKFETPESGFEGLINQVNRDKKKGLTIEKFIYKYAPPSSNNTESYIKNICAALGSNRNELISNKDSFELAKAVAKIESNTIVTRNTGSSPVDPKEKTKVNKTENGNYITVGFRAQSYKSLVAQYFPAEEIDRAMRIMQASSSGDQMLKIENKDVYGDTVSTDFGLFRINNKKYFDLNISGNLQDPNYNVKSAAAIFKAKGWSEWEVSTQAGVLTPLESTEELADEPTEGSKVIQYDHNNELTFRIDPVQFDYFLNRRQVVNNQLNKYD